MAWNPEKKADAGLLAVQFCTCVVSWTAVVFLIGGVSGAGFAASIVSATALVLVSWVLIKMGLSCGCDSPARLFRRRQTEP